MLERRHKERESIAEYGCGVKVLVPKKQRQQQAFIHRCLMALSSPQESFSEQFRVIRNHIKFSSKDRSIQSLLVTSPAGAEGKSTAAINLAISTAQRGDRVLLVDANFRNPSVHLVFDLDQTPGLSHILSGQQELASVVQTTDIGRLDVIASGPKLYNMTELIGSQAMNGVITYAREHYDLLVFDCPSVLDGPDANVLASKCDGVVLLLCSGKTKQAAALEARRVLALAEANIIGIVMNRHTAMY